MTVWMAKANQADELRFTARRSRGGFRGHSGQPAHFRMGKWDSGRDLPEMTQQICWQGPKWTPGLQPPVGLLSSVQGGVTSNSSASGSHRPSRQCWPLHTAGPNAPQFHFLNQHVQENSVLSLLALIFFSPECQIFPLLRNWQGTSWVSPQPSY